MSFRTKNEEDRISSLPEEILSQILSSMPTKFAVRTCILSKRWRYKWTLVTNLDFDEDDDHPVLASSGFHCFVDRVFELCKTSKIKRFRFCSHRYKMQMPSESKSNMSRWINEAVRLNVREVDFKFTPFELPCCLFTCKTLTGLSLAGMGMESFIGPNVPVSLPLLKTLHITFPIILPGLVSVNAFRLINGCPMLESLSLETSSCFKEEDYDFNIPTLKRLKIRSRGRISINKVVLNVPNLEYLCFDGLLSSLFLIEDVSSLVEATVRLSDFKADLFFLYTELLKGISGAKSISWSSPNLDVLLLWPLPKFPNLTNLKLKGSLHSGSLELFQHLESSSMLEHLCFQEPEESCWIEPQSVPTWMLTNLKTMEIRKCKGRECDMQFLEDLLCNSEVLQSLTVTCEDLSMEDEKQLCARLFKCSKATTITRCCNIHFVGKWLLNIF